LIAADIGTAVAVHRDDADGVEPPGGEAGFPERLAAKNVT